MSEKTKSAREIQWTMRWRYMIDPTPVRPGVWRRKDGGFLTRARVKSTQGKQTLIFKVFDGGTADAARQWLVTEMAVVRTGTRPERKRFDAYAASVFERKAADGTIRSAKSAEKWEHVLELHLFPAFGMQMVDAVRTAHVLAWRDTLAARIQAGELSPRTAQGWMGVLKSIFAMATLEFELPKNPTLGVPAFDTREHPTYTDEEPNSLTPDELKAWLALARERWPQHYAMMAVGFATGRRPSELRPLRRKGPRVDFDVDAKVLHIRRSHTRGPEVMETTKTDKHLKITLPSALVEILREHVRALPLGAMADSDLLFPSRKGSYRTPAVLDKPFADLSKALGLGKHVTPRAMRRTFQDLARAAQVTDIVTRAISGHATEEMQRKYSTVYQQETEAGLAKILDLGGFRTLKQAANG